MARIVEYSPSGIGKRASPSDGSRGSAAVTLRRRATLRAKQPQQAGEGRFALGLDAIGKVLLERVVGQFGNSLAAGRFVLGDSQVLQQHGLRLRWLARSHRCTGCPGAESASSVSASIWPRRRSARMRTAAASITRCFPRRAFWA